MPNQDYSQNNQGSTQAVYNSNNQYGGQGIVSINAYEEDYNHSDDEKFFSVRDSATSKKTIDNLVNSIQHVEESQQTNINGVYSINKPCSQDLQNFTIDDSQLLSQNQTALNSNQSTKKQLRSLMGYQNEVKNVQSASKQQATKIQAKSQVNSYDNNNQSDSLQNSSDNSNSNTKDDENVTDEKQQIPRKNKNRKDVYGNKIRKGGKKHKIVFADHKALNKPLNEIHFVESYKKYNTDMSARGENKSCCTIF